jgi:hypothetical protein
MIVVAAIVIAMVSSAACTPVRPWERAKLAHPTMKADGLEGPAEAHVRAVHEGAAGGGSVAESGCGCN